MRRGPPYAKANTSLGGASLWVLRGHEPTEYRGVAQFLKLLLEPRQQVWRVAATGWMPITRAAVKELEDGSYYQENPDQWAAMSQLSSTKPTANSRGIRLGNDSEVRAVIESELGNIFRGTKTVKEGLDAAVVRGNAILREFAVTHGAAAQGEI
jgi:sn-glycerol 3-phosphate transport system substrate-binding protein